MVVGLTRFRDHFAGFEEAYVLIGGTACDAWLMRAGLPFRRTKDLDIVLLVEALTQTFVARFWEFVQLGGYEVRQKQSTGKREFFRFLKPKAPDFPFMLELFSRAPEGIDLAEGQEIVPIPLEEAVASLSGILMDSGYYDLVVSTRHEVDGVSMVGVGGLIPLKARAWLDMNERRRSGRDVDGDDIKKHRNDVFRLALTLAGDVGPSVGADIREDLRRFLEAFADDSPEWPGISHALRETVRAGRLPSPAELRDAIVGFFRLG